MVDAALPNDARPEPSRAYRWTVLLFVSLAMGGNYYIYDSISPLGRIFIDISTSITWDSLHGLETITTAKSAA